VKVKARKVASQKMALKVGASKCRQVHCATFHKLGHCQTVDLER